MNKKVLIISPFFAPSNAADMQRIRMSLPYFRTFSWDAEIVTVDPMYSDMVKDELLMQSIPPDISIHQVEAFDKKWTSKFGLGSLALRSLWFFKKKVNKLLSAKKFDLIYFSTTQFPVCILGNYWKKKFNIPYVIDMQDPWHSDYYRDKPKDQRPPKYWFSYRLNKYLEPIAIKRANGLIAVSEKYIIDLKNRYMEVKDIPASVIPFGAFSPDIEIAKKNHQVFKKLLYPGFTNIVYIGRGGSDMHQAVGTLFSAVKTGMMKEPDIFNTLRFYFIGTSYAAGGTGKETILPLAKEFGIEKNVIELTDRISFYHTLATLQDADALFIPGSDSPGYSASKIYNYILAGKPLLTIFNSKSPAMDVLNDYGVKYAYSYDATENSNTKVMDFLKQVSSGTLLMQNYNEDTISKYSSENMTRKQCLLFDKIISDGN